MEGKPRYADVRQPVTLVTKCGKCETVYTKTSTAHKCSK